MKRNICLVILSAAKNLAPFLGEMLRYAQHDNGVVVGMFLRSVKIAGETPVIQRFI